MLITKQTVFSLLEVLISLVIVATGLLGLTGMQSTALMQNHSAYQRSLAAQLAYDISDRMRVNKSNLVAYETMDPSSDGTEHASCLAAGCTAAEMIEHDLFEWQQALTVEAALPLAEGSIVRIAGVGDMFTISISWDEDRDGTVDGDDPTFETRFHP